MKTRFLSISKKVWLFIKNHKKKVVCGGVVFLLIIFSFSKSNSAEQYAEVKKAEFVSSIGVSGKVKATQYVDLGFETAGKVSGVKVQVGDRVTKGTVLATLANTDAYAQILEKQSILAQQAARLSELEQGTRPEELAISASNLSKSESSATEATRNLINAIKNSFIQSDDAIRNRVDQLYTDSQGPFPQILPFDNSTSGGFALKEKLDYGRRNIESVLLSWQRRLATTSVSTFSDADIQIANDNTAQIKSFLDDVGIAVSLYKTNQGYTQTNIDKYRSDVSQARQNVVTASTNLYSAQENYRSATSSYIVAQKEYDLKKAGPRDTELQVQEAQVGSAQASVQNAQGIYSKTVIVAPFDGIITKQDAKEGGIASPNTALISLINDKAFEVEAYVPEVSIAKLKVGDVADITLDAYGSAQKFEAAVTFIDPAETVRDGVSNYKIKLTFVQSDERIRSGMTADIFIITQKRSDVVFIPARCIAEDGVKKVVLLKKVNSKKSVKTEVTLGENDGKGQVEILSGLEVGDTVVLDPQI